MSGSPGPRVVVLYDSSYLMADRDLFHEACEPLRRCAVTNVLAQEVQEEVGAQLKEPGERGRRASLARKRMVALIRQGPAAPPCQEVRLREKVTAVARGHVLGADSTTDRLLLAYAQVLAAGGDYAAVVLATNDGGIQFDAEKWRQAGRRPLFCLDDPRDERQVSPLREALGLSVPPPPPPPPPTPTPAAPFAELEGHTDMVSGLAFSPDGRLLASTSTKENAVRVWAVPEGRLLATLTGPQGGFWWADFGPSGRTLVTTGEHGTTWLWAVPEGQARWGVTADDHHAVQRRCLAPDDQAFATATRGYRPGTYERGPTLPACLELWRVGEPARRLAVESETYTYAVTALAFSPDSALLAAGQSRGGVYLVDVAAARVAAVLDQGRTGPAQWGAPEPEVTWLSFSPDGRLVAWATQGGEVKAWDVAAGRPRMTRRVGGRGKSLAFSPDGQLLAVCAGAGGLGRDDIVYLLRAGHGEHVADFHGPAFRLSFSPDGRALAGSNAHSASGYRLARVWSVPDGRPLAEYALSAPFWPTPCAVSPGGQLLATANCYQADKLGARPGDFRVQLWRLLPP